MGVARSALFYLCDRFESVSENTPCAKRRGVAGFPEASTASFGGSTVVAAGSIELAKPTRVTSDQENGR